MGAPGTTFQSLCMQLSVTTGRCHRPSPCEREFPIALRVDNDITLFFEDEKPVAGVTVRRESGYSQQKTSVGRPFVSMAVLEGRSTLAFFYLLSCDYIKTRETCSFCFQVFIQQESTSCGVERSCLPPGRLFSMA